LIVGGATLIAGAAPAGLDLSFNPCSPGESPESCGGKVKTAWKDLGATAHAVAVMDDGKIVVAGTGGGRNDLGATGSEIALIRYHPDGSIDRDFGSDGKVTTVFPSTNLAGHMGQVKDLEIAGDKILAAVTVKGRAPSDAPSEMGLVRFNYDGSLDDSFGLGGMAQAFAKYQEQAEAMVIQPDGKVLVGGKAEPPKSSFAIIRFLPDGALDASFGTGGKVTTQVGDHAGINDLLLQGDKILAIGYCGGALPSGIMGGPQGAVPCGDSSSAGDESLAAARYNLDGTLDATFGQSGLATTKVSKSGRAQAGVLQGDKIVLVGTAGDPAQSSKSVVVARYTSSGAADSGFGTNGSKSLPVGRESSGEAVLIDSHDRLVITGSVSVNQSGPLGLGLNFLIMRVGPDGVLDSSFGQGGTQTTDFGGEQDEAFAVASQSDGKIVAVGRAGFARDSQFAVARYSPGEPWVAGVDPNFDYIAGGKQVRVTGYGFAGATAVAFGDMQISVHPCPPGPAQGIPCFTENSDGEIVATVPPSASAGKVHVRATTPDGVSRATDRDLFEYRLLPSGGPSSSPVIASIEPRSGPVEGGTRVVISGAQLGDLQAVYFDGMKVTQHPCPASGGTGKAPCFTETSNTEAYVYSPAIATAQTVHVRAETTKGTSMATPADMYSYLSSPILPTSAINSEPLGASSLLRDPSGLTGSGSTVASASKPPFPPSGFAEAQAPAASSSSGTSQAGVGTNATVQSSAPAVSPQIVPGAARAAVPLVSPDPSYDPAPRYSMVGLEQAIAIPMFGLLALACCGGAISRGKTTLFKEKAIAPAWSYR